MANLRFAVSMQRGCHMSATAGCKLTITRANTVSGLPPRSHDINSDRHHLAMYVWNTAHQLDND
jgi:hypothetical protein